MFSLFSSSNEILVMKHSEYFDTLIFNAILVQKGNII